jgi:cysteinyl-tRNA synthetase
MAMKLLGETLDIHGGGLDLQFPHHENELAQSESYTDKPFAHVWMHNGLLKMGKEKMAGSVGNVVNIADLLKKHSAETVRFLLLSTHYRSPIEYSEERLEEVAKSLQSFYRFFERYEQMTGESFYNLARLPPGSPIDMGKLPSDLREQFPSPLLVRIENIVRAWKSFMDCMQDDFNTGGAIGHMFYLVGVLNNFADEENLEQQKPDPRILDYFQRGVRTLRLFGDLLGLFSEPPVKTTLGGGDQLVSGLMQLLLDLRENLRTTAKSATKDNPLKKPLFDQTDLIRSRLKELGVTLEDRPGGTTWRVG